MGERVRHHISLRLLFQTVVADRRSGLQRLIDVAGIEERCFCSARFAHTPARQSACSSMRTCRRFASVLLAEACCICVTRGRMPSSFCT